MLIFGLQFKVNKVGNIVCLLSVLHRCTTLICCDISCEIKHFSAILHGGFNFFIFDYAKTEKLYGKYSVFQEYFPLRQTFLKDFGMVYANKIYSLEFI